MVTNNRGVKGEWLVTTLKTISLMTFFLALAAALLFVIFYFLEVATRPDYRVIVYPYVQEAGR